MNALISFASTQSHGMTCDVGVVCFMQSNVCSAVSRMKNTLSAASPKLTPTMIAPALAPS